MVLAIDVVIAILALIHQISSTRRNAGKSGQQHSSRSSSERMRLSYHGSKLHRSKFQGAAVEAGQKQTP